MNYLKLNARFILLSTALFCMAVQTIENISEENGIQNEQPMQINAVSPPTCAEVHLYTWCYSENCNRIEAGQDIPVMAIDRNDPTNQIGLNIVNNGIEMDKENNRLKFNVNRDFQNINNLNYRSEIRLDTFPASYPLATKQKLIWTYYFPDNYLTPLDTLKQTFSIYQNKMAPDPFPNFELTIVAKGTQQNIAEDPYGLVAAPGEIQVINRAVQVGNFGQVTNTGIVPKPGDALQIQIDVEYSIAQSDSCLKISFKKYQPYNSDPNHVDYFNYYANKSVSLENGAGGNHKFGLYAYNWLPENNICNNTVNDSCGAAINLEMGPLTFIKQDADLIPCSAYYTGNWGYELSTGGWSDMDNDGINDAADLCEGSNDGADTDNDGIPDGCDCILTGNTGYENCNGSNDTDGDGICDNADICQGGNDSIDYDGDGIPYGCDLDETELVDLITSGPLLISALYEVNNDLYSDDLVASSSFVEFKAGNSIILNSGFEVEAGANFHALIQACGVW